ncbi:MDR family MFS transporter [Flavisolibacter ginsenosidimutans]|uniref:MFS transporter n=1 Tax=Flavisolibacter ginsenosidimutans TaxID=661481 RepID=A0A5B8UIX9_9BACT|nr:MFS transporter [Flavisolibacter ginsenosidimutans]QEC56050.1 MFS transporter [Flavisolibacter ginsenosidimutans]
MLQAPAQLYKNAYSGIPRPVWWLGLVMFVNRCGTMVIPFLTVYLTTARGFSLEQAGYVMAAFGTGSILGSYLGGKLTDKFGSYYVQFFSLLLNGIMFIVLGRMQTLAQFAVCIFVLSSLGEAFRPANSVAIANYSDDGNRIRCYSLNRLAINLGWSIGPAVGGILASVNYGLLFWADGLTCIAASILLLLFLRPGTAEKKAAVKKIAQKESSAYQDGPFLRGMAFLFLIALAFFQLFSVVPVYYKSELGLNEATIGWILAMNGLLIAAVEMVLVYKLEGRKNSLTYIMTGAALIAVSFLFYESGKSATVAVVSMILVTFGEMFLFPFMNNFWVKRSGESNRGQYASVYMMAWSGASVLAPTLATQVAARAGFGTLWIVDFLFCTMAAAGFYFLKKSFDERV